MPQFEFVGTSYALCNGAWYKIGDTINAAPGTPITVYQDIKETKIEAGTGVFRADVVGGANKCRKTAYYTGGETKSFNCSFNMPSSNEDIKLLACHYYGGQDLIHDTECCFKLRPTAAKIDFRIRVLDDVTLLPIYNAIVDLTIGSDYTDADGYTKWWEVDKGVLITGTITKTGYTNKSVSITPLADATWTQYMEPTVEYCSQNVYVVTSDGATVSAKVVWGDGASEYGGTPNTFTHRYVEGINVTVTASATGYSPASKTFNTCISQFTLTLEKIVLVVDFRIRVLDDVTLLPIYNAIVDLTIGSDYTDADGYTKWWEVDKGVLITGTITKTGYTNKSVSITPLADATWTQYMEPVVLEPEFEFVDSYCYLMTGQGQACYKDDPAIDVMVGSEIMASARVKNVGDGAGAPTLKVYQGTTKLCEKTGASIVQGAIQDIQIQNCFTMPDANRDIVMKVYYGTREDDSVGCGEIKEENKE